jgi:hypothetical protein
MKRPFLMEGTMNVEDKEACDNPYEVTAAPAAGEIESRRFPLVRYVFCGSLWTVLWCKLVEFLLSLTSPTGTPVLTTAGEDGPTTVFVVVMPTIAGIASVAGSLFLGWIMLYVAFVRFRWRRHG